VLVCCEPLLGQATFSKESDEGNGEHELMGERTKPRPSRTASTMPAVNDEQLSWLISRGTDICRSIEGSLSMIMSVLVSDKHQTYSETHTFILVRNTFLNCIGRLAKYRFPYLRVYRHQGWQEPDFAFGCFGT
jgi:hypothetical protein